MKIKDKILNYYADKLKDYRTKEYDFVSSCYIPCEVKKAFFIDDCTVIKEKENKYGKGFHDLNNILDDEFKETSSSNRNEIIFIEKENVICLYSNINNGYYESVHEFFDPSQVRTYIKLNEKDFKLAHEFISQSGKYHDFIKYENEIPYKKVFDKIYEKKNDRNINKETLEKSKNQELSKSIRKQIDDIKKEQLKNRKSNKSKNYER